MTLATDQNLDPHRLSPTARRMLELRDDVLWEWAERVRQSLKEAEQLPHPILINTFPSLYDNIAEAITPGYPRATGNESNTVASEHGGERARLTNYNVHSVIFEYQILRWTIFDVLKANDVQLNDNEIYRINASIDGSVREAVNAFALAQLALRERFMAALTHDLRNPLSNAKLAAQLIERSSDPDRIKEFAGQIVASLKRMDGMIQDLLDAAKFQSGERLKLRLEEFDMQELAKEVCEQFTFAHGPRFQLIAQSARVWWDREAVKRVMENLLGNALKYGTPDAPVRIKIDPVHGRVMLTVHNEGEPIPPEQIESLFQVFQRAAAAKEGNRDGWGIGLPYVRSVAESHGGSIEVDSAEQRGTTFLISMPADARPYQHAPTLEGKRE
ncbi:Signal transduction histidine kinase [Nitrosospira sp. Nsp18]|uniref:sensor histidine kinase n=1 Tax=Nitrosospira sp. Nsp18 TaxID=1855334 RepID=UPI000885E492|nr:HAMP domain-containing sensor histidine kinase [Nitrosospira sp. Nsp18]SDA26400.1 Signal transduction histidine kinase [Nitrosospira sp. Nsp18]